MNWLAPAIGFVVCWLSLTWLLRHDFLPMDHPNARSLHQAPTPRIGGLGIMLGIGVAGLWLADGSLLLLILATFSLAALSVLDDVRGLPVTIRFLTHLVVTLVYLLTLGLSGWPLLFGTLATVWMVNLYNFMDGSDGLAGGMAAIGFSALALASFYGDANEFAAFCASIAASALAFLRFNFPPARLFMGDVGSIPLGFLAATTGILGIRQGLWPWVFPLLVFSPFIVDTSVTLARRAIRGEKVWQAHRSHYYQRVVMLGASHRQLAVAAYSLMMMSAATGFLLLAWPRLVIWLLVLWSAIYVLIFLLIDRQWRRAQHGY